MFAAAQHRFPRSAPWFLAPALLAIFLLASACSHDSPEQAVRKQVEAMQSAIDARDAGAVDDLLADDFVGNEGLDKRGARQLAVAMFLRYRDVSAKLGPATVELRGGRDAVARFSVLATGGSGGLLPDSGQVYEVETGWRLVDGEWKLLNASWKEKL
ncbi:MAG TPA: nuclear transport factor 2 family protein [Lysobacter sp.]|nr:nuclear transport factor 2 family protein [Lysobacter sp.]